MALSMKGAVDDVPMEQVTEVAQLGEMGALDDLAVHLPGPQGQGQAIHRSQALSRLRVSPQECPRGFRPLPVYCGGHGEGIRARRRELPRDL
eukprot:4508283-Pyramimonas_sp.AAC.1